MAPKKINLVAAMIRRLPVQEAAAVLQRTPKKAARIIERALKSAVANAEHNLKQKAGDLYVKTLIVNQASSLRRHIYRARGMARPIRKFTSHVSVELGMRGPEQKKSKKPQNQSRARFGAQPKSSRSSKMISSISSKSSDSSTSSSS